MSKLVYLITVWGGAQKYLVNRLQVQQLTAARVVCGYQSHYWSRRQFLDRAKWLSVMQLIFFHTVLQAYKTTKPGLPIPLRECISTDHILNTRNAARGQISFRENFRGESSLINLSFRFWAAQMYNKVPVNVKTGSLDSVKKKLKKWVCQNMYIISLFQVTTVN